MKKVALSLICLAGLAGVPVWGQTSSPTAPAGTDLHQLVIEAAPGIKVFELSRFLAVDDGQALTASSEITYTKADLLGAGNLSLQLPRKAHLLVFGEMKGHNTSLTINANLNLAKIRVTGNPELSDASAVVAGSGLIACLISGATLVANPSGPPSWQANPLVWSVTGGSAALTLTAFSTYWFNRLKAELVP